MFDEIFGSFKKWIGSKTEGGYNIKVSQKDLKNLSVGKVIIFKNLPELVYQSLIGKSIDIDRLQFEIKLEILYDEEGFTYKEFKLEDEGFEFWLEAVRDMGTWNLSLWKRLPDLNSDLYLKDGQVVHSLEFEGHHYNQDMSGRAKMQIMDNENPQKGTNRFWRFQCQDDPKKLFAVTDWMESGFYECAVGEWIKEKDFEVLLFSASFQ